MSLVTVGLLILVLGTSMGTKEKSKVRRKKSIAVTDPQNMRTLEEWINLEREVLEKLCKAVKLPSDGTLTEMARSLMQFYRQLNTHGHPDTHGTSMGTHLHTRPNHIRGDWHHQPTTTYHHKIGTFHQSTDNLTWAVT